MALLKKKCKYCGSKIEKGKEFWEQVKIPEFNGLQTKPFCSKEHAEEYQEHVTGTPSRSSCPFCKE